jgi:hypothetical protein
VVVGKIAKNLMREGVGPTDGRLSSMRCEFF